LIAAGPTRQACRSALRRQRCSLALGNAVICPFGKAGLPIAGKTKNRRRLMKKIVWTVVVVIVVILLGGIIFIASGVYNVAATSKDSPLIALILEATRERSVESRADNVVVPPESVLTDPNTLRLGFEHYNKMCVICHNAPGVKPSDARVGLNPKPPLLFETAGDLSYREGFWVVKNGIKMTAMPAWGVTHSDEKIWAIVAFVKTLPGMTPAQYQALRSQNPSSMD